MGHSGIDMPSRYDNFIDKLLVFISVSSGRFCGIIDNSVFIDNLGKDEWFEKAFVINAVGEPTLQDFILFVIMLFTHLLIRDLPLIELCIVPNVWQLC